MLYNNVLSKEQFIDIINKIKEQDDIDIKVSNALELVCDGVVAYGLGNKYLDALFDILRCLYGDSGLDDIIWYLWDRPEDDCIIYYRGIDIEIKSIEDLYYLVNGKLYVYIDTFLQQFDAEEVKKYDFLEMLKKEDETK